MNSGFELKNKTEPSVKALALMSSGLDSLLAAKIVSDQGVEVHGIYFLFRYAVLSVEKKRKDLESLVAPLGISVSLIDISEEFLPVLKSPDHGYGSGFNPCIDCHLFMLKYARNLMDEMGARFLVTGEVVGQRPMSQTKPTLFHIDKVSGLKGIILRPLSAKLLPPTVPEQRGWVNREDMLDISGRSRKRQIALAGEFKLPRYNAPAGGCVLTEPNFSKRAKAFIQHRGKDALSIENLKLLRYGRHFWPKEYLHVIVGRDAGDNDALEGFRDKRWFFTAADTVKSPVVIAEGVKHQDDIEIVARITARYCKPDQEPPYRIKYESGIESGSLDCMPFPESQINEWRL